MRWWMVPRHMDKHAEAWRSVRQALVGDGLSVPARLVPRHIDNPPIRGSSPPGAVDLGPSGALGNPRLGGSHLRLLIPGCWRARDGRPPTCTRILYAHTVHTMFLLGAAQCTPPALERSLPCVDHTRAPAAVYPFAGNPTLLNCPCGKHASPSGEPRYSHPTNRA